MALDCSQASGGGGALAVLLGFRGDWWSAEYCGSHSLLIWIFSMLAIAAFCIMLPLALDGVTFSLRWLLGRLLRW